MDLVCHKKLMKKSDKYNPLVTTFRRYWGRVDLVCIPIGHAGITLNDTASNIATALAKVLPSIATMRKRNDHKTPEISKTAILYGTRTAKTLLKKLCSLAQTRLLGILAHRQQKNREQTTRSIRTTTPEGAQPTARRAHRHPPMHPP